MHKARNLIKRTCPAEKKTGAGAKSRREIEEELRIKEEVC